MRRFCLLLLLTLSHGAPAAAQSVTIDALMASPFPTELVAAPSGARFAWVQSVEGIRNIWIADGPDFAGRRITSYTVDDGQDLTELTFTGDGKFVVFTRGEGANRQGESPNPSQMPDGAEQAVWAAPADAAGVPSGSGRRPSSASPGRRARGLGEPRAALDDRPRRRRREGGASSSRRAAPHGRSSGRRTAHRSPSSAAAARTASSASSASRRRECGTSTRRSIATVRSSGRRTARASPT